MSLWFRDWSPAHAMHAGDAQLPRRVGYTFNCQDRDALLASLGNAGVTIVAHRD